MRLYQGRRNLNVVREILAERSDGRFKGFLGCLLHRKHLSLRQYALARVVVLLVLLGVLRTP